MAEYEPTLTSETEGNSYRVKLVSQRTANEPIKNQQRVTFNATPDLSESRTVNYSTVEPVHMPGQIFVYKNVSSRTFSLSNIKLISRTPDEADANIAILWTLRGWTMPRFGKSSTLNMGNRVARRMARRNAPSVIQQLREESPDQRKDTLGSEQLGAPPEVLLLSAYSRGNTPADSQQSYPNQHLNKIPVVIQSLNIPYPSDIDYILSTEGTPMPTIMTIDMQLVETHSAREYDQFSLEDYRNGRLQSF